MTKAELVAQIADKGGITKSGDCKSADGFLPVVSGALTNGDKITLVVLETLSVALRFQGEGPNPRTGEKIEIPASKFVKFNASET